MSSPWKDLKVYKYLNIQVSVKTVKTLHTKLSGNWIALEVLEAVAHISSEYINVTQDLRKERDTGTMSKMDTHGLKTTILMLKM